MGRPVARTSSEPDKMPATDAGYTRAMTRQIDTRRWKIWLPTAAAFVAIAMIALAFITQQSMEERNEFALDGRLLGLAHAAESRLRDSNIEDAQRILDELFSEDAPDVTGLILIDSSGVAVAEVGRVSAPNQVRSIDLFLGRGPGGNRGPPRQSPEQPAPRGQGRGRFELRLFLDPATSALPLTARFLVPTVTVAAIALVWLAVLAGRLLDRQRNEIRQVSERRRLEALARAGAGLAHQLRTPLATIKGTSQLMSEHCDNDDLHPRIETVITQADRMNRLLGRLLDYARPPIPEPRIVRVTDVVGEAADRHPHIRVSVDENATALVDREHLVEILDNLLANAVFFNPEDGAVVVDAAAVDDELRLTVRDDGPGPGDDPEIHFEPYQTSRADGTGLGLPIARALAEANGGSLVLKARAGGGCEAILTLPKTGSHP